MRDRKQHTSESALLLMQLTRMLEVNLGGRKSVLTVGTSSEELRATLRRGERARATFKRLKETDERVCLTVDVIEDVEISAVG